MKFFLVLALVVQATIISSAVVEDGGVYRIRPKGFSKILGIEDESNEFGARLIAEASRDSNYQRVRMHQVDLSIFHIEIVGSGLYVSNYVIPPVQAGFDPIVFQQTFELIPASGGFYMIRPAEDVDYALTLAPDDTSLVWQQPTGDDNQLFFFCSSSVIPSKASRRADFGTVEDNGNSERKL